MRQDTIPIEQIIELCSIRGHPVTAVIERSESIIDLTIQSKQGQKWFARYAHVDVIDAVIMRGLLAVKQTEDAVKIALITAGTVSMEARQMADGLYAGCLQIRVRDR